MTAGKTGNLKPLPLPEWNAQPQDYLKRGPLLFSAGRLRAGAIGGNKNSHILLYGNQAMVEQNPILVRRGKYLALEIDFVVVFGTASGAYHIGGNVPQDNDTSIVPL